MTDAIAYAAMHDREVHYCWLRVVHLLDPPRRLFGPTMLARTAAAHLRRHEGGRLHVPAA
ncbi:MAG TPA: hypothetical protein VFR86_14055 [Burkholderiaceae bacterium]|nr:hypothetical protein [Burkholderiaceae bacterium]